MLSTGNKLFQVIQNIQIGFCGLRISTSREQTVLKTQFTVIDYAATDNRNY